MEVILVIAMFVVTALSLNCIASGKTKLAGACNIINLCLIVAVAYQFKLVNTIIIILVVLIVLVVATMILLQQRRKKKEEMIFEGKIIENKESE